MTDPKAVRVPDLAASLIRTWVPIAAGAILTWLAHVSDFALSPEASTTAGAFTAMATAAAYYGLARALEAWRGHGTMAGAIRKVGTFMLGGVVKRPVYLNTEEYERLTRLGQGAP